MKEILAQDVINWGDGGGKAVSARRPIVGIDAVIPFWLGLARKQPAGLSMNIAEVNGSPAVIMWISETLYNILTFEIVDGKIQALRGILNPDKLRYIARQL